MLKGPKHCWNLHDSISILFFYHFDRNWVPKSLLLKSEILEPFVKTLIADNKYSPLNKQNLR